MILDVLECIRFISRRSNKSVQLPPQIDPFLVGIRLEDTKKLTKETRPQERIRQQFSWLLNWGNDEAYENLFETFTAENKMHPFMNPIHDNRIDREFEGKVVSEKWKKAHDLGVQKRENVAMGRKENYGLGSSNHNGGSSSSSSSYEGKNPGAHVYGNPDRHKLWKLGGGGFDATVMKAEGNFLKASLLGANPDGLFGNKKPMKKFNADDLKSSKVPKSLQLVMRD